MRIRVHDDAADHYRRMCFVPGSNRVHRQEWEDVLRAVQGQWLEVETDHLFGDQFNTVPIPGVTKQGLRLMIADVAEIEDDARPGVIKCSWCYGYANEDGDACAKCGKSEYLRPLNVLYPGGRASDA